MRADAEICSQTKKFITSTLFIVKIDFQIIQLIKKLYK